MEVGFTCFYEIRPAALAPDGILKLYEISGTIFFGPTVPVDYESTKLG
jgi:hypothetical protein